jgi:hypothetical protein
MAIWTSPEIRIKAGTIFTREYWIAQAKGITDDYGNPFRAVMLRWNWSNVNMCAENVKTQGFEDAIIYKNNRRGGGLGIRYRLPGNLTWNRPLGGIGDFQSLCPVTPHNMQKLASCFKNNTWRIIDDDIRTVIEEMWKKKWSIMDEKTKRFNTEWFRLMRTMESDLKNPQAAAQVDIEIQQKTIADENLEIARKKQDQDLREAQLNEKEKDLLDQQVAAVVDGKEVFRISERSLRKMKLTELKKHARKLGLSVDDKVTKDIPEVIRMILDRQGGDPEVIKAKEQEPEEKTEGLTE